MNLHAPIPNKDIHCQSKWPL